MCLISGAKKWRETRVARIFSTLPIFSTLMTRLPWGRPKERSCVIAEARMLANPSMAIRILTVQEISS